MLSRSRPRLRSGEPSRPARARPPLAGPVALRAAPLAQSAGATPAAREPGPMDPRALLRSLPPLVKGYLRLGATFSPAPAIDRAFNSTDLFVALPLAEVEPRYLSHFGVESPRSRLAA